MSLNLDSLKRFIDTKRNEPDSDPSDSPPGTPPADGSGFQTPPSSPPRASPANTSEKRARTLSYKDKLLRAYDSLTWTPGLEHAVIGSGAIFLHALRLEFTEEDILHQLNPDDLDILYHNPSGPVSDAELKFQADNFHRRRDDQLGLNDEEYIEQLRSSKGIKRLFEKHMTVKLNNGISMEIDFADANSLGVSDLMGNSGEFPDVVDFEDTDNPKLKIPVMNLETLRAIYDKQNTDKARIRLDYIDQILMPPIPVNI